MEGAGSEKRGDRVSSQRPRRLLPPVWVQKGFWWCRVGWQLSPDRACLFCLYNVFQTRPLLPVSSSIPGQPIFPASLWPCLLHPCPSTRSPFSPQGDSLEPQTRACHFLHKRPSVASSCTWMKTQAPSAGGRGGLSTGPAKLPLPRPLRAPGSATLASSGCPELPPASLPDFARAIASTWRALATGHPR